MPSAAAAARVAIQSGRRRRISRVSECLGDIYRDPGKCLLIWSGATTYRTTPLSLTFHPYFKTGDPSSGSIADHDLQIYADEYVLLIRIRI